MIPLYKPYMPTNLPDLENVLYSGELSYGKWGRDFETKLKEFVRTDNLLTTNSYASAIYIALTVLGLKYGDEVIASPMSCLASNLPLATYGLKIVWADIDPTTGTLSPDSVRQKITPATKLIFHNHFCGYIGYVNEVNAIGKEFDIPVIDDCIEAFGSEYLGKKAGCLGTDITLFSFQTVRLPNTIDGGAIVFKDKLLFDKALLIRDFGIDRQKFRDENNEISWKCDISLLGYGGTMSEMNSYIGSMQMEQIVSLLNIQSANAFCWDTVFHNKYPKICKLNERSAVQSNYWVYGFLTDNKLDMMLHFRNMGYYASGVHINNNCYSVFGEKVFLPGVHDFHERFIAIPCGWWVEKHKIQELF